MQYIFFFVTKKRPNKLECLPLANLSSLVWYSQVSMQKMLQLGRLWLYPQMLGSAIASIYGQEIIPWALHHYIQQYSTQQNAIQYNNM